MKIVYSPLWYSLLFNETAPGVQYKLIGIIDLLFNTTVFVF